MSMIDVSNLTFGYEGSPELIFDHVGFQIDSGWKLGFTGRNGRGKTTFLRLLQGEYPYSGTISASVEFEYFPYEVANLSRTGLEVLAFLQKLNREGTTVILITHDNGIAATARRCVRLTDGRIVEDQVQEVDWL